MQRNLSAFVFHWYVSTYPKVTIALRTLLDDGVMPCSKESADVLALARKIPLAIPLAAQMPSRITKFAMTL